MAACLVIAAHCVGVDARIDERTTVFNPGRTIEVLYSTVTGSVLRADAFGLIKIACSLFDGGNCQPGSAFPVESRARQRHCPVGILTREIGATISQIRR